MSGEDASQKDQQGADQQAPKADTSKIYSNGYNNGLETAEKRILKRFSELTGQDYSSVDEVYDWTKTSSAKLADSISDPTQTEEYKSLQAKLKDYEGQLQEAQSKAQAIANRYKFDSTWDIAESGFLKNAEYIIPKKQIKTLWDAEYQVEFKDGKEIVKKGELPVMNDSGEYKPLQEVIKDFSKQYLKTTTRGTGGGTGDGTAKPKFEDYKKAKGNNSRKAELLNQAKAAGGWAEEDAPSV